LRVKFHISYLNATLKVKPAMALIYGETLIVAPIFLFLLPAVFGITGIWWSLAATQVMMLLLYQIVKELKITVDRTKKVDYSIL
jgi:Na+-driven multidrug efflux pump